MVFDMPTNVSSNLILLNSAEKSADFLIAFGVIFSFSSFLNRTKSSECGFVEGFCGMTVLMWKLYFYDVHFTQEQNSRGDW